MWTVVYMAQEKEVADKIQEILEEAGLLSKIRALSREAEDGDNCYEILVPESEVEEAHSVIIDKGF